MALDRDLRERIRGEIQRDPLVAQELLGLVGEGLTAWRERVEKSIARDADMGVSAALGLPAHRPGRKWLDLQNEWHRTSARMTAVGWNLHRRRAGSRIESDLVEFVREADALDGDRALRHYATLTAVHAIPRYRIFGEEEP